MKSRLLSNIIGSLSLTILLIFGLYAQTTPGEPNENTGYEASGHEIAPPSPTAASLGKYGEFRVGGSSGTPAINIPLFEIKGSEMSVPVSLSYAGGGIKVNDIASWVGLGWSLNAGGVITRTIQGNPDESAGIYDLYNSHDYDPATFSEYTVADGSSGLHTLLASGVIKGEPDMYSFNFLGYSGQFYIDHTGEFYFFEQQDLKIEREVIREFTRIDVENDYWEYDRRYEFTVTTGNGIRAVFTNQEITSYDTGDGSSHTGETAWYLTELTNGQDTFTFSYEDESISYGYQFSETEFATSQTTIPCVGMGLQDTYGASLFIDRKRLTSITGPFGTATFIPSSAKRRDIGGKSLVSIQYQDLTVEFNTYYDEGDYTLAWNGVRDRLFLNSVSLISGNDSKGYSFDYSNTKLPPTNSYAQDFWGYFNGKTGNTTLLPGTDQDFFSGGANRDANPQYMQAGILTGINYPTGGYTEFVWEPNHKESTSWEEVEVCPSSASFGPDFYHNDPDPFGVNDKWEESFSIGEVFDAELRVRVGYIQSAGSPEGNSAEPGEVDVKIKKGSTTIYSSLHESSNSATVHFDDLSPGTYTISMTNRSPVLDELHLDFSACYLELQPVTRFTYYGGLRADTVKNYADPLATSPSTKVYYDYGNVVTSSYRSSIDFLDSFEVNCADELGPNIFTVQRRSSNSQRNKANGVSYEWVREVYGDGSSKTTRFHTTPDNFTGSGATQDRSWMRSKPKLIHLYDKYGSEVRKEEYSYSLIRKHEYLGVVISKVIKSKTPFYPEFHTIEHKDVSLMSDWARLDSVVTTEFFPSGNLVTKQEFDYFRPDIHIQPGAVQTTFPDGAQRTRISLYPLDINAPLPGGDLRNEHFLKPIESITYDPTKDKILSGSRMQYTSLGKLEFQWNLDSENGITYSGFVFASGESDPTISGTSYFDNPAYGDVEIEIESVNYRTQTLKPRSGVPVTYLWGYNNRYPVAELRNITFDQLLNLTNQSTITNLENSTDDTQIKILLETIRDSLSEEVQMTSYLYKAGIGVSEIIDPNEFSTYFNYDGMGRLVTVKDDDGNLLTSHEYLYALETN